jgi:hypothetical protein
MERSGSIYDLPHEEPYQSLVEEIGIMLMFESG